jgi:acyl carrier protein
LATKALSWYFGLSGMVQGAGGLKGEIKRLLVSELNLAGRDPAAIDDEALLFDKSGLGLDSLDALQIAMFVEERFGVRVPEGEEARPIFRSVSSLAEFIEASSRTGA